VGWHDALLLESVGQAIRGAAFAIPGSLGAQEGGYLLLAPLVGLPPDAALALSLASACASWCWHPRLNLHFSERKFQRRRAGGARTLRFSESWQRPPACSRSPTAVQPPVFCM
jgi:hypothetical protein